MAPVMLDRRVLAWRAKDVADEGLYQPEALNIQTLRVPNAFTDSRAYGAAFKWHVMEEVRTQVQSELELLGAIEPSAIKITNMTIPDAGPGAAVSSERNLTLTLCNGDPNQNKKLFLPWEVVLLSDKKVKSYAELTTDTSLMYAFLLMTPASRVVDRERDENGGRVNSNTRCANALVCPDTTAMWARLQDRIARDLPEQFWCLTPLANIATMRRVSRSLQNIEEGGGRSILDKILDPVPGSWAQPQLCEATLHTCIRLNLNRSQAEAVAAVAGTLNALVLTSAQSVVHVVPSADKPDPTDYYGFNAAAAVARSLKPSRCREDVFGGSSDDEGTSGSSSNDSGESREDLFSAQSSPTGKKEGGRTVKPPRVCNSAVLMIQGPPGTGKTRTISQMCTLLAHPRNSTTILVCAPSNVAIAEIAKRLLTLVPPYDAPRGDHAQQQNINPAPVRLMVRGGLVRGAEVEQEFPSLQAFTALSASRPSSAVAQASTNVLTGQRVAPSTPSASSWAIRASQLQARPASAASTSAATAWPQLAKPQSPASIIPIRTRSQQPQHQPLLQPLQQPKQPQPPQQQQQQKEEGNGILRRADVFLIGSEDRLEASGGLATILATIHVNARTKSLLKALGPCRSGGQGQTSDCSWGYNLTELRSILDDTHTTALDTWASGAGGLGRTFKAWLHDTLYTRYQQMTTALDVLGNHLPTNLMGAGLIPAAENLLHSLTQLLRAVKDTSNEEVHTHFSDPDNKKNKRSNNNDNCPSSPGSVSSSSDESDTAQPSEMRRPAAPAMPPPPPRRFLNRGIPLPPISVASLCQELQRQLLSLPTTLHPDTKAPETNEWADVEPWLVSGARILLCTVSMAGAYIMWAAPDVDMVIIDESAQLVEAEAAIVHDRFPELKLLVLVGDHKQLPATVLSDSAKVHGYGRSLFERFQALDTPIQLLNTQYRMHPAISLFPRNNFYADTGLMDSASVQAPGYSRSVLGLGLNLPSMCFINVEGAEVQPPGSKSFYNDLEAQMVARLAKRISTAQKRAVRIQEGRGEVPKTLSIGVVTMYSQQVSKITSYLKPSKVEKEKGQKQDRAYAWVQDGIEWEVRSVDGFQGRETDIIIFSTVRCNKGGFLGKHTSDPRRINVALTRARHMLVVVGSEKTLGQKTKADCKFPALIKQAREKGGFMEMNEVFADRA